MKNLIVFCLVILICSCNHNKLKNENTPQNQLCKITSAQIKVTSAATANEFNPISVSGSFMINYNYSTSGSLSSIIMHDSANQNSVTSSFFYSNGKLMKVTTFSSDSFFNINQYTTYSYDGSGKVIYSKKAIAFNADSVLAYSNYQYNTLNQIIRINTYASLPLIASNIYTYTLMSYDKNNNLISDTSFFFGHGGSADNFAVVNTYQYDNQENVWYKFLYGPTSSKVLPTNVVPIIPINNSANNLVSQTTYQLGINNSVSGTSLFTSSKLISTLNYATTIDVSGNPIKSENVLNITGNAGGQTFSFSTIIHSLFYETCP